MISGTHVNESSLNMIGLLNIIIKNRAWAIPYYFCCNFSAHFDFNLGAYFDFNFGAQNFISLMAFGAQLTNFPPWS